MTYTDRKFLALITVLTMAGGIVACGSAETDSDGAGDATLSAESAEAAEHAEGADVLDRDERGEEGEGEHNERGEGREGAEASGEGEHAGARESRESRGEAEGEHREGRESAEHDGEEGEGHDEGGEGEESGVYIAQDATWDVVRRGARLVLSFDAASNAFTGTVENTTNGTLCAVRVEVHLGGGSELGPTPRTDLAAGATTEVRLLSGGESFETWTAHPELSACGG